eukprot:8264429-Pyramimonas_sp.AAC.1
MLSAPHVHEILLPSHNTLRIQDRCGRERIPALFTARARVSARRRAEGRPLFHRRRAQPAVPPG